MIRFTHLCGSLQGTSTSSPKKAIRIGTSADCDVRYDPDRDPLVSNYHAAVVLKDGAYHIIDTGSARGLLINDRKMQASQLRSGDHVRFGAPNGPEATVEVTIDAQYDAQRDAEEIEKVLKTHSQEISSERLIQLAAKRVAEERAKAGGTRSRRTMEVMAHTLGQIQVAVKETSRRKWVKVVAAVAGVAIVVTAIMGSIIYRQHQLIAQLLDTKGRLDAEIHGIQLQMQNEQDSIKLADLERQLDDATIKAERTLAELGKTDKQRAAEAAEAGDELDKEIHAILRQFDAETYAVPPIFKERLQYHIYQLTDSAHIASTRIIYRRKLQYWPGITKEFQALGLPDAMGYVAWTESRFDPDAVSVAGAKGLWQMTTVTAKSLGLKVEGGVDERRDVDKQTRAAAHYLANLLAEFGEDAFMLAMASYNRGENGVRRVLHQVAQEPGGFKKEKRDFWHLYRTKKLPNETREYVPKILAAAVVCAHPERFGLPPATSVAPAVTAAAPAKPVRTKGGSATGR
jgi:hypothetical protein